MITKLFLQICLLLYGIYHRVALVITETTVGLLAKLTSNLYLFLEQLIFTLFLRRRDGVCLQVVCSFVRSCIHPITKCTSMYYKQTAGPRSVNFCTHAYWQGTFVCHISSKSSTSFTFNFKVNDSNRIHSQVHTWNLHEMHFKSLSVYPLPQRRGTSCT